jgi:chromosome segregation and condensation protein ScpB
MNNRQRFLEIEAELKKLRRRRRELLEERRQLSGVSTRATVAQAWVEPIFAIIENHSGISRREIIVKFNNPHMTGQDLTNCLTTLRRRGWIENRGTKKHPQWYSRGRTPRKLWNTRESRMNR